MMQPCKHRRQHDDNHIACTSPFIRAKENIFPTSICQTCNWTDQDRGPNQPPPPPNPDDRSFFPLRDEYFVDIDGIKVCPITEGDSYGEKIWPSCLVLLHRLKELTVLGTCLDAGCGCGLVGLYLCSLGLPVTLLDADPLALNRVQAALELNNLTATVRLGDWQTVEGVWDNVLASDVLYADPGFLGHARRLWSGRGYLIIADPGREMIEGSRRDAEYRGIQHHAIIHEEFTDGAMPAQSPIANP